MQQIFKGKYEYCKAKLGSKKTQSLAMSDLSSVVGTCNVNPLMSQAQNHRTLINQARRGYITLRLT